MLSNGSVPADVIDSAALTSHSCLRSRVQTITAAECHFGERLPREISCKTHGRVRCALFIIVNYLNSLTTTSRNHKIAQEPLGWLYFLTHLFVTQYLKMKNKFSIIDRRNSRGLFPNKGKHSLTVKISGSSGSVCPPRTLTQGQGICRVL